MTVQGPARRVDLVVPAGTPVAELLPGVVALGTGGGASADDVRPWRLSRPVGPDLDPGRTLAESGVGDGDLLLLRHESTPPLGVLRSDPVVALAGAVDGIRGRWSPERRTVLALSLLAPALAVLLVATALATGPATSGVLAAVAVAVLLLSAGATPGEPRPAAALCVLALLPGAALGRAVAAGIGAGASGTFAWAALGVLGAALLGVGRQPARTIVLAVGAVATGATATAALGVTALGGTRAAAVGLVASLAVLPFLPRLALRGAGLVHSGDATPVDPRPVVAARVARTSMTAALAALAPVVAVLAGVVALYGGASGRWLAALAGLAFLLRARAALFTGEVLALVLAGTAALGAGAGAYVLLALAHGLAPAAVLPPAGLSVVALLLALPATRAAVAAPGTDRRLRQLEAVALLALVPLALAVLGVLGVIADAASGLR